MPTNEKSSKDKQKKTSAYYTRLYRERLKDSGLVKKEIHIQPANIRFVPPIERALRNPDFEKMAIARELTSMQSTPWTVLTLYEALSREPLFDEGHARMEVVEGLEPTLYIEMTAKGALPVFLSIAGQQMLVETLLWFADDVVDRDEFNEAVLRTHKFLTLSTISLDVTEDGDAYFLFGALSSTSSLSNIMLEIEFLTENALQAVEAYADHLKVSEVTS